MAVVAAATSTAPWTTAARLGELGALLVDLSGQHQHQGLVDPARHLEILDVFGDASAESAAMTAAWAAHREASDALEALGGDEREREARVDYLRFQLDELDGAALKPGEDAALEVERTRLAAVDQLQSAARAAEERLYSGDASARDLIAAAGREVERAMRTDPALAPIGRQLAEIESLLDDAADQLRGYADKLEGDPERLAALDERIELLRRLVRKHAAKHPASIDGLIAKAGELRAELAALTGRDAALADAQHTRQRAEAAAITTAAALTKIRTKAARKLEKDVGAKRWPSSAWARRSSA